MVFKLRSSNVDFRYIQITVRKVYEQLKYFSSGFLCKRRRALFMPILYVRVGGEVKWANIIHTYMRGMYDL